MDDDRTLLELAAKAAGHEVARWTDDGTALLLVGEKEPWNALHNNPHSDCMGDALRLAVKMDLWVASDSKLGQSFAADEPDGAGRAAIVEPHKTDACAATRRAILRAAAAMAQTTKEQP